MDFLPQRRPPCVLNVGQVAEIIYTDRETGSVVWRQQFLTMNEIPAPPLDLPNRDYTVQMTWREDWLTRVGEGGG